MKLCKRMAVKYGHWIFFAFMVLITAYMDVYVAANLLDGDASDFMNRASIMAEQNNLFTRDFYGTTELRLLDIAAVFSLFFHLTDNWMLIRILGTLAMQAYYVLSFLYLCRQSGVSGKVSLYAAGMLLLPFSTVYARIVLYHAYYLLYMSNAFWIMGLTLRLVRPDSGGRRRVLPAVLLAALWVFVGLNGIRHMMIVGLPMLLFATVQLFQLLRHYRWQDGHIMGNENLRCTGACKLLTIVLLSFLCFAVGFVLNKSVLVPYFGVNDMSQTNFVPNTQAERYAQMFNGWLVATGIRYTTLPLVGIRGLALVCALYGFGYLLAVSLGGMFSSGSLQKNFTLGMLGAAFTATTLIFIFESGERSFELYYVPVACMALPALAMEMDKLRQRAVSACRKLMILLTCACFLFQGVYSLYYIRVDRGHMDTWSGLIYKVMDTTDRVRDCVAFMQENGYTFGLIDYWYANTMIEMSDGELNMAGFEAGFEERGKLEMQRWGTSRSALEKENLPEKAIVFIDRSWHDRFESIFPDLKLVHEGWIFNGYEADSSQIQ